MTTAEKPYKVHEGRNVKRFREMKGMKQETFADALGDDWSQKKVSLLEAKETIDPDLLEKIASVLNISPDTIRNFNEDAVFHFINNFNDSSVNHGALNNYSCTFNPIDKLLEIFEENKRLYERLLESEREKLEILRGLKQERK